MMNKIIFSDKPKILGAIWQDSQGNVYIGEEVVIPKEVTTRRPK